MAGSPVPKAPKPVRNKGGRARPDEPLAVWCEAVELLPDVCDGRAWHRHHIRRRSQGGTDDRANTVDLCAPCHAWTHGHPVKAESLGLLDRSTFTPTHESEEA